jgi:hypothetical protein
MEERTAAHESSRSRARASPVTCLMPGTTEKDVARTGFEAMMRGEADVVSG